MFQLVVAFQLAMIAAEVDATVGMLEEQGIRDDPVAGMVPSALVGVASDGRDLGSLLTLPDLTETQFDRIVATQLQDVSRHAAAIERAVRPDVTHYVRVVNLPACGRCIVLAGKPSTSDVAFKRHPQCDCGAVPSTARLADRVSMSPRDAYGQMDQAEKDKAFTKSGSEAIRLGADPVKVVNARRGMATAQGAQELAGHTQVRRTRRGQSDEIVPKTAYYAKGRAVRNEYGLYTTTEGVGTRGSRARMSESMRAAGVKRGPRLMPESIVRLASTDAERVRLLRAYGYITN